MINRELALSGKRQVELVGVSRGSVYYLLRTIPVAELTLMRRIDELHINHPYAGSLGLCDRFQREGLSVGRKHVRILMWRMGIQALYRRPGASKRHPGYTISPYLLGHLAIAHANQVCCARAHRLAASSSARFEAYRWSAFTRCWGELRRPPRLSPSPLGTDHPSLICCRNREPDRSIRDGAPRKPRQKP